MSAPPFLRRLCPPRRIKSRRPTITTQTFVFTLLSLIFFSLLALAGAGTFRPAPKLLLTFTHSITSPFVLCLILRTVGSNENSRSFHCCRVVYCQADCAHKVGDSRPINFGLSLHYKSVASRRNDAIAHAHEACDCGRR